MAARDIMPWRAPEGGTILVTTYYLAADETFEEGEVVTLDAVGQLEESVHDPSAAIYHANGTVGISAEPAAGMASDAEGTTNAAWAARGVWRFSYDQEWITPNFTDDQDGNALTNDAIHARVGETVGLSLNTSGAANVWSVSQNADTANQQFRIIDILDANKQPIRDAATVATWVIFRREEDIEYGDQS